MAIEKDNHGVILEQLKQHTEILQELKQEAMKLNRYITDPETGLSGRVKVLEASKIASNKLIWIVVSAVVSLIFSTSVWMLIFK